VAAFKAWPLHLPHLMYRKLVNIILVLLLCITMIPIEQVGNALFNNQWTEECNEHDGHQPVIIGKFIFPDELGAFKAGISSGPVFHSHFFEYSQSLPFSVSSEIHSPPPNML
jgi:hypothetical protein